MSKTEDRVKYRAAIYMRLSKEDGDKQESDSIANQKALIKQYLRKKPEITIVSERADDGYSGVFFERPAFVQMVEDIKNGNVNCVVVKDLSRLGRNYIEAGKAVLKLFPIHDVRFISINDNIDTTNVSSLTDRILISFKNMMNDGYCRDISIKVRSQQDVKRKNGDFIGSFTCYGYAKSPENKNKLIIDENAALVVKDIFKWKIDGMSQQKIADKLNELGVLSPSEYKKATGSNYVANFKTKSKALWTAVAVSRILKNEVYIGNMEQGKEGTPNYKVKKRISRDKENWDRVEGTHEPIISKEDFKLVNNLLDKDLRSAPSNNAVYPFSGVIYCNDCGNMMIHKPTYSRGKKYSYYICSAYKNDSKSCKSHMVSEAELSKTTLLSINYHIECIINIEEMLVFVENLSFKQGELIKFKKQISQRREEIDKFKKRKLDIFEDFREGRLDNDELSELKQFYNNKLSIAEKALKKLLEEADGIASGDTSESAWIEHFKKHRNAAALSRNLIVSLIDKIMVSEGGKVNITFKYKNEFDKALNYLLKIVDAAGISREAFAEAGYQLKHFPCLNKDFDNVEIQLPGMNWTTTSEDACVSRQPEINDNQRLDGQVV